MKRWVCGGFLAALAVLGLVLAGLGAAIEAQAEVAQAPPLGRVAYIQGGDVWVKDLPDGTPRRLTTDGQRLAYVSAPDIGYKITPGDEAKWKENMASRRIWVMNRDGRAARQLTHEAGCRDEYPRWSADGQHILFTRTTYQEEGSETKPLFSLWLLEVGSGRATAVVSEFGLSLPPGKVLFVDYYGYIDWSVCLDYWPGGRR